MTTNKNASDGFYLEPQNFNTTSVPTSIEEIRARYATRKAQIDAEIAAGAQAREARYEQDKNQNQRSPVLEPIVPQVTQPLPRVAPEESIYSQQRSDTYRLIEPAEPTPLPGSEAKADVPAIEAPAEVIPSSQSEPVEDLIDVKPVANQPLVVGTQSSEMIVDLPQGQKFTLRGMSPGTIIEIASWSGSGSPDEGAIRMLFGATRDTKFEPYPVDLPDVEIQAGDEVVNLPPKKLRKDGAVSSLLSEESAAELTQEQLEQIKRQKMKRRLIGVSVFLGSVALLIAAIFGLRAANLIYFEHPTRGITTGLGGAETAIAVVSPGAALDISSTVIAEYEGEKILAAVTAIEAGQALLITGAGQIVVPIEDITGRLLFVLPFLGVVVGWFGG